MRTSPQYMVHPTKGRYPQPVYRPDWEVWQNLGWNFEYDDPEDKLSSASPQPSAKTSADPVSNPDEDVQIYIDELESLFGASGWSAVKRRAEEVGVEKPEDQTWEDMIPAIAQKLAAE